MGILKSFKYNVFFKIN